VGRFAIACPTVVRSFVHHRESRSRLMMEPRRRSVCLLLSMDCRCTNCWWFQFYCRAKVSSSSISIRRRSDS
jgi:hypothetical protein